jgi:transcriptional regulator with XRE-family HTH domain
MARSLGDLLRERRNDAGLTQAELADRLVHVPGMAQGHLSLMEKDKRPPTVRQLAALVEVLDLDGEELREVLVGSPDRDRSRAARAEELHRALVDDA